VHLNELDKVAGRPVNPISKEEQQAAYAAEIVHLDDAIATKTHAGQRGYGLETHSELHGVTISNYSPFLFKDDEDEAQFVRAAFDLRKVRLEHEGYGRLRYPHVRQFKHSIDYAVLSFILVVGSEYFDSTGQWKREEISDSMADVLDEIQQYGHRIVHRRNEIQRLQPLIKQKRDRVLELNHMTMKRDDSDESVDENELSVDENELLGMQEQIEEMTREVEDLQDDLEEVIRDTMMENPYASRDAVSDRPVTGVFS
jgi:hypothetical protein